MASNTFYRYLGLSKDEIETDKKSPVLNKRKSVRNYILYMLDRTSQMFEWDGLPPTMPVTALERMLQMYGYIIVAKPRPGCNPRGYGIDFQYSELESVNTDMPYAFWGSFGEAPDPYYAPYKAVVANPGFIDGMSFEYTINEDCVICRNDREMLGLMPMFRRYAWEMADAAISLRSALLNLREQRVIVANNDRAYESAMAYLNQLEDGELGVIMDQPILGDSKVWGAQSRANAVIQAIEAVQYIKSAWFNEVGLQSAFNMKREYLSQEEVAANTDLLTPLPDDMLACRERACKDINSMFGLNVSVKKNSAWERKDQLSTAGTEQAMNEAKSVNTDSSEGGDSSGEASY